MKGILIYPKEEAKRNSYAVGLYQAAAKRRNAEINLCYFEDFSWGERDSAPFLLYQNAPVERPDFIIMRAPCPKLSYHLEKMGIRVLNPAKVSEIANDKFKTIKLAESLGIPVPKTVLADKKSATEQAAALGFPLVIKPCDGHGGQDVLWAENEAEFTALLPTFNHEIFLLQSPVADLGRDKRVYVLGGKPVCAMLRKSDSDFRSNFCLGGRAEQVDLTAEEADYVARLCSVLSVDFAGIDFLYDGGKAVLGEMEDIVGARMVYSLTDRDIIDEYVAYILSK